MLAVGLMSGCAGDAEPAADTASPAASVPAEPAAGEAAETGGLTVSEDGLEVSYAGVAGKTALELLLQLDPTATTSGEGELAFVTGIGGRTADAAQNEFWAFYVNGEMAAVGAGSYVTADGDVITWKLETFGG